MNIAYFLGHHRTVPEKTYGTGRGGFSSRGSIEKSIQLTVKGAVCVVNNIINWLEKFPLLEVSFPGKALTIKVQCTILWDSTRKGFKTMNRPRACQLVKIWNWTNI